MTVNDPDPLDLLRSFAEASAEAVKDLKRQIPAERLRETVRLISGAETVSVAGRDSAYPVAAFLDEGLKRRGYRGRLLHALDPGERRHVEGMRPRDVLLAVSFEEACPVADFIPIARERRVSVIGITAAPSSPVARSSDLNLLLQAPRHENVQLLAPYFALVQSLLMALKHRPPR